MPPPPSALDFAVEELRGVNICAAPDQLKKGEFSYLQNVSTSIVGQLSQRAGTTQVGPLVTGPSFVHSIFYLSDPVTNYPTKDVLYFVGAGTQLYAWDGDPMASNYSLIASGFSGNPLTGVVYRLSGNGKPWLIIGDSLKMIKVDAQGDVFQLGITPPVDVAQVTVLFSQLTEQIVFLCGNDPGNFTFVNTSTGPGGIGDSANMTSAVRAGNAVTFTTSATNDFVAGLLALTGGIVSNPSFIGTFKIASISSSTVFVYPQVAANATITSGTDPSAQVVCGLGFQANSGATAAMQYAFPAPFDMTMIQGNPSQDSDTINVWMFIDDVAKVSDVKLYFDIDPTSVSSGTLTASAFSANFYEASVFSQVGTGWNLVTIAKSAFTRTGQGTFDWSGVVAWQVVVDAVSSTTPLFYANNMYLQGASYPDASVGVGYDWRYTFYNSVTQSESNPSPVMAVDAFPIDQPVELIPGDYSADPQVNEIRWYRRGGTLASNWFLLGSQPNLSGVVISSVTMNAAGSVATWVTATDTNLAVGDDVFINGVTNPAFNGLYTVESVISSTSFTTSQLTAGALVTSSGGLLQSVFIDGQSDLEISAAPTLSLQNDVPVTTVDESGTIIYGQPLPYIWGPYGGTEIFGDGDRYRPGTLYWSNANNPDAWGSLNNLEVTSPSDPLTLGVYWQGTPWARSMESLYQIFPAVGVAGFYSVNDVGSGESVATPWAVLGGSGIPFMPWVGKSGIFISSGGVGQSITDNTLWPLFDPKSTRTDSIDWTKPRFNRLAWYDHHLRWTYCGKDNVLRQYLYNVEREYWTGPNVYGAPGTYEFNQPEVQENLLIGAADGNLYQWDTAATTDAVIVTGQPGTVPIVPLVQTAVYIPAGWQNEEEWLHVNVNAVAPVGGILVKASFNSTLTAYTTVGQCVNLTRAATHIGLGDVYSRGMSLQYTWSGVGTLYGWSIIWRDDGQTITHAETPPTSYGCLHFQHAYKASVALRSTGIVNVTVVVDNVPLPPQPVPSTGNTRLRQDIYFPLNKGQLFQVKLDAVVANQGFRSYAIDSSMELLGWDELQPREVPLPFVGGNSDN